MVESNYEILGVIQGASKREIREAFRKLALQLHADRGGADAQFIKIKQAFDDLKIGKVYPDSPAEKFGVWGKKKFMGKEYMGIIRSTFLVDEKGKIFKAFPKVKPAGHAKEVLEAFTN